MKSVAVTADNFLRVDGNVLGNVLVEEILDDLTIENEEKTDKLYRGIPGAEELPDDFLLADLDGDELVMSRGYALRLKRTLRRHSIRVRWDDNRKWDRGPEFGKDEFSYLTHQPAAVAAIKHHEQGIYVAPTGSGKTVVICGALWELCPRKALILVNRIDLVDQWRDRIMQHTGADEADIGRIGEGEWDERRFTVATLQTIWSKREELAEQGWFDQFDFVCLDECHHVTADTFNTIMNMFPARIRVGTSATPGKTGHFKLATTVLGEIFYEDDYEELIQLGVIMAASIEIVATDFSYPFWSDHKVKANERCKVPGCTKRGAHGHRNNYQQTVAALVRDSDRNQGIWNKIHENTGRVQLIVTDRTTHIDALAGKKNDHGSLTGPVFRITGKDKGKVRAAIIKAIEEAGEAIIFSTVAGEGLDIPIIDRVHLVYPMKNEGSADQKIGRGVRTAEGKLPPVIYDYADVKMGVFRNQLRQRMKLYRRKGFKLTGYMPTERDSDASGLGRLGMI